MLVNHLNHLVSNEAFFEAGLDEANAETGSQVGIWVPSEQVLVFRLELPKVSKRKLQEMLPWLLEDRLLSPPEDFEFFLGASVSDTEALVYAVEKASVRQWLQITDSVSVTPERFVPDFLALSYEDGYWSVYEDEGRLLVRTGLYEGFAVDSQFGWQQIQLLINQQEEPVRISLISSGESNIPDELSSMADRGQVTSKRINWEFSVLPSGIDLLPASFRPKSANLFTIWAPVASCFGLFVLFVLTYMLVQSWVWQRDIQVLEEGVAATYESLFSQTVENVSNSSLRASADHQISLLEHQYIGLQTAPVDAMVSLDSTLSACTDCALLMFEQTNDGVILRVKDSPQSRRRLAGLGDWDINWSTPDQQGFTAVNLTRKGE